MSHVLAIIIVNYNGLDDTVECLKSLRSSTFHDFKVIVVDNASRENPLPVLTSDFSEVCCLRSKINLGFTGGNNLGLAKAGEFDPKYIFYLNNDTVVTPDTLAVLVEYMEQHPEVGITGPLTYYYDEPDVVCFCGGNIDRNTGRISFNGKGARLPEIIDDVIYCSFVEGAAIVIRTSLAQQAGGFNDDYFLTSEESELCIKVADMGYKLSVLTTGSIRHKVSRSMGAGSELINYFVYRNRLKFIRNNASHFTVNSFIRITSNYIRTFASLLIKERNFPAARGLVHGVIDFLHGVTGPGRYREQLQLTKKGSMP
jgi:GT2 family glycosyltransferase